MKKDPIRRTLTDAAHHILYEVVAEAQGSISMDSQVLIALRKYQSALRQLKAPLNQEYYEKLRFVDELVSRIPVNKTR